MALLSTPSPLILSARLTWALSRPHWIITCMQDCAQAPRVPLVNSYTHMSTDLLHLQMKTLISSAPAAPCGLSITKSQLYSSHQCRLLSSVLKLLPNGIIQYALFCVWLFFFLLLCLCDKSSLLCLADVCCFFFPHY